MFTAALLRIAKKWKRPKCTSAGEWIKKIWHMHTLEKYSLSKEDNPTVRNDMDKPGRHCASDTSQPPKGTSRMTSLYMRYFKYSNAQKYSVQWWLP